MTTGSRTEGLKGMGSEGFIRTVKSLTVLGDLVVHGATKNEGGSTGSAFWETADANANYWAFELPIGGDTDVPVIGIGIGLADVDLGLFNGVTQPTLAVIDADRDSYIALDFSGDDAARIKSNTTIAIEAGGSSILDISGGNVRIVDKLYFYDRGGEHISSDGSTLSIGGTVAFSGDVTYNGSYVAINASSVHVDDPMIHLGDDNSADSVDLGMIVEYTDSGKKFAGLFRDASDSDKWKLFARTGNSDEEPTTTVNTTSGFALANLAVSQIEGTIATASQTNITAVGTITTGTWEGTTIAVDQGGTGATSLNNLITLGTHTTGNYVATITGGTGIDSDAATSGEGTTHTLSIDLAEVGEVAIADGDYIAFMDATDSNATKKEALADVVTLLAGTGLAASSSVLSVDLNEVGEVAIANGDYIPFIDATDSNATKKEAVADLASLFAGTVTSTGLSASSSVLTLDIQNMTASTTIADADLIVIDDGAGGTLRKMTRANFIESAALDAINIDGGDISAVTISGGLTWNAAQNLNNQNLTNVNIDSGDISAATISGGLSWSAAQNLNSQNLTNVNIDSGTIDAVTIGTNSAVTQLVVDNMDFNGSTIAAIATAHDTAGTAVTISAGDTTAGTTNNIAGGALTIQGGQGKGSGAGGDIIFQTANAGASGSSLNALATALTLSDDLSATFAGAVTIGGNLTVNGSTVTTNSTTVTIDDPIFTLGGDTAPGSDDNKDRGIEFRYYDSQARIGFFGYDDSAGVFTGFTAASNSSEVFSGTVIGATFGAIAGTTIDASTDFTIGDTVITDGVITDSSGLQLAANLDIDGTADISGDLTLSGGADGALQFTNAGENSIKIPDDQASALIIEQADNAYMTFTTTNSSEKIVFAKALDVNAAVDISGDLTLSAGGDGALVFANAGENSIKIPDGQASALIIEEANNAYMTFTTTNSGEKITVAKAMQVDNTITVGVDDTGYDVKLFGAAASAYLLWDEDENKLLTAGDAVIDIVKDKLLIGGTAVTTTAAELNLLDTAAANSVVNSKAVIYGSSGELAGTLSTAAQANVTSLGTLTALNVDNININANTISATGNLNLHADSGNDVILGDTAANYLYIDGGTNHVSFGATAPTNVQFSVNFPAETYSPGSAGTSFFRAHLNQNNAITVNTNNVATIASLYLEEPNITESGVTVASAATLYIGSVATEADDNYAIWSDAGDNRFDGNVVIGGEHKAIATLHVLAAGNDTSELQSITIANATNNRYAVGLGSTNVFGVGQRMDFYAGDSGSNDTALDKDDIQMVLTAQGRVGIGVVDPAEVLSVDGDIVTTGDIELGHASDTTLARSASGVVTIEGAVIKTAGTEDMWIPATAMRPASSNGCAAITDVETTATRPDMMVLDFDSSTQEYAQFSVAMPKSWNEGTVTAQFYWTHATAVATDVIWGIQGVCVSDNDTIDVAYGTAVTVTDTFHNTAEDLAITAATGAMTLAGSPAAGDLAFFQVYRDADAGGDTTNSTDARLIGVKIIFTTNATSDA